MEIPLNSGLSLRRPWKSWWADLVLIALVSGPLAAPFLAASELPILEQIADIIYWLGIQVCPQPDLGPVLAPPHIMAVCMRCYGTLMGLVVMRVLYSRDGQGSTRRGHRGRAAAGYSDQPPYWLDQYGLWGFAIAFALCMVYPAELALQGFDWWPIDNIRMTLFGWIAGLGLGAYLMPILHGTEDSFGELDA
ncbi:hypothetical protein [Leptolyngbya sp. PCC 6406]|uniref:hypothetical protein n=1 Tax=Leptolyngbya sp. PCC 6406 TaxID=1173264 RepID=UPI0002ABD53D|nr:hypothetical protein [Leptolyngbya sp. PCC 6406]